MADSTTRAQGEMAADRQPGESEPATSLPGHERPRFWFDEAARRGFADEGAI